MLEVRANQQKISSYWTKYAFFAYHIYTVSQKVSTFELSATLSNLNRFSNFLNCWKACKIYYKIDKTIRKNFENRLRCDKVTESL